MLIEVVVRVQDLLAVGTHLGKESELHVSLSGAAKTINRRQYGVMQ